MTDSVGSGLTWRDRLTWCHASITSQDVPPAGCRRWRLDAALRHPCYADDARHRRLRWPYRAATAAWRFQPCRVVRGTRDPLLQRLVALEALDHAASARRSKSISFNHASSWFQLGTVRDVDSRCARSGAPKLRYSRRGDVGRGAPPGDGDRDDAMVSDGGPVLRRARSLTEAKGV